MGIMGSAMAFNLLKSGEPLRVWNRNQSRAVLADLAAAGAEVCNSLKDCLVGAELIFTCLGDENDVVSRLTGQNLGSEPAKILPGDDQKLDSVLAHGSKGALVVDFSTIGPVAAKTIAHRLRQAGLRFLDAPVTGGDVGAKNATLTIMVGGEPSDFDQALPSLEKLGKNIRYCEPSGAGQALKLCNQVLCAVNMMAVCEALALAENLDLDPGLVVDVLQTGAGGSWALANLGNRILQDDLKPAFSIRNMLKDLRLVFDSASSHANLPGSALSVKLFEQVARLGNDAADDFGTQAMIKAYIAEELSKR